jgi:hypothetical protein
VKVLLRDVLQPHSVAYEQNLQIFEAPVSDYSILQTVVAFVAQNSYVE